MSTQKLKRIDLDFPHSWDELTGEQMEHIHKLKHQAIERASKSTDPEKDAHTTIPTSGAIPHRRIYGFRALTG